MVLLAWDYISGISKSHCPEASLGKYIARSPAESHAGPVSREGIPWWFESGTALGYSLSISPLCGAHMAMGQVGRDSQQGIESPESKKGANFFVLRLKIADFWPLQWPYLFWLLICTQV